MRVVSIIMYACVCGKKPFLAGGNPFRPAINTVIRLDLPYNPHRIGDTQFSSTIFILYLSQPYKQRWCSFSELAYQTLTMMISLDVRMPFACLEYFASFDIIFACYYNSYIFWDTILSVVYQKCAVGGQV